MPTVLVRMQIAPQLRGSVPAVVRRVSPRRMSRAGARVGLARRVVTVRLAGNAEVARLNSEFLDGEGVTDVLSFPSNESDELGDVVIAWPYAQRKVAQQSHVRYSVGACTPSLGAMLLDEVVDLGIHALAHLLGHDHGKRSDARTMLRVERRLARAAHLRGLTRPYG